MKRSILISAISIALELGALYLIEENSLFLNAENHFVIMLPFFIFVIAFINFLLIPLFIRKQCNNKNKIAKEIFIIRVIFNGICYIVSLFYLYGLYVNPDILFSTELLQPIIQKSDVSFTVLSYLMSIILLIVLPFIRIILLKSGLKTFSKHQQ